MMQFDSILSFLSMGGYGLYVWLSFGISFGLLLLLLVLALVDQKALGKQVISEAERKLLLKQAQEKRKNRESKT